MDVTVTGTFDRTERRFASAEIAVLSVSETKLAKLSEQGNKKASRLMKLTRQPAKFLATIQVAITLSGFLGSAFAADNFSDGLVSWLLSLGVPVSEKTLDTIAVVLITLILSYFTLILESLYPSGSPCGSRRSWHWGFPV